MLYNLLSLKQSKLPLWLIYLFVPIFLYIVIYYKNYTNFHLNSFDLFDYLKRVETKVSSENNDYFSESTNKSNKVKFLPKCKPFLNKYQKYQYKLDGEIYPKSILLSQNESINFECLNKNTTSPKLILYWNSFFDQVDFSYGLGKEELFLNKKCPVTNCETTNDKSRLAYADFVLVHMRDNIEPIPSHRPANQRWVFVLYESPVHSGNFMKYNGLFNLTATYRIDSDFPGFYDGVKGFVWKLNESFVENHDYSNGKSRFATAVISNCGGSSNRLTYIKKLQKRIPVDVYGACGSQCPTTYKDGTKGDCKEILAKEYKFYFAFENSICRDYITEKFFQILKYDIVPVVLGGGNYSHYVPKSGYIDVSDFPNPQALADYLLYLDKNATAYNSYFKWKKYVSFFDFEPYFSDICDMCIQLNLENHIGIQKKIVQDIGSYWSRHENCRDLNSPYFFLIFLIFIILFFFLIYILLFKRWIYNVKFIL